jgi:hypothetical protein
MNNLCVSTMYSFCFEQMERKTWADCIYRMHRYFILAKRRAETWDLLGTHAGARAAFRKKVNDLCSLYYLVDRPSLWSSIQSSWLQNGDVLFSCEARTEFIYDVWKEVDRLCDLVVKSSWLVNRDVLRFLWGTSRIYEYICYVEESRPPLWSGGQCSWLVNRDVLRLMWGTSRIYEYICYVEESRPSLWSSGQSSWLQNGDVFSCETRT